MHMLPDEESESAAQLEVTKARGLVDGDVARPTGAQPFYSHRVMFDRTMFDKTSPSNYEIFL